MDVRANLVIFYAYHFDILMPSGDRIGVWRDSDSMTWNILPHRPRVYIEIGRPSKTLTLEDVDPLNTVWKKEKYRRQGTNGYITTHNP